MKTGFWKTAVPALCGWHRENRRELPWRRDRDPYHVWVSEIMLQQTRIEAVIPYYERFIRELPDIPSLADVEEGRLLKLWEGLGYYSRARNLKKAARMIVDECGGVFPEDEDMIRKLPGIGPYTAGAILSIAYGKPAVAVDGNVLRIYARLTALSDETDRPDVRKRITEELKTAYRYGDPVMLTEGLMALGQEICIPNGKPRCNACPLKDVCRAGKKGNAEAYPKRLEKRRRTKEKRLLVILMAEGRVAITKRSERGLLAGLWEFPAVPGYPAGSVQTLGSENAAGLAERVPADETPEAAALRYAEQLGLAPKELLMKTAYTHIFTHKEWEMDAVYIKCNNHAASAERNVGENDAGEKTGSAASFIWVTPEELTSIYALPSAFRPFCEPLTAVLQEDEMTP